MKKILIVSMLLASMLILLAGCEPGTGIQINPAPKVNDGTKTPSGQIDVPGFKVQFAVPGPNPLLNKSGAGSRIAGILPGIWHGMISPITLVWSLLNPNVQMYEVHNNGGQYNLGYLIGMAILFIILGFLVGRRRR